MSDLISRSALIERYGEPCHSFIDIIESMPAVDAVPMDFHERCLLLEVQKRHAAEANQRHGRWEAVENTGPEEWCAPPIRCSNCCKTMPDMGADFCPFCGQMNAEVHDETATDKK